MQKALTHSYYFNWCAEIEVFPSWKEVCRRQLGMKTLWEFARHHLPPALMGPTAPPTHQHKQSQKLSKEHWPFNQKPLQNWKVRPPTRFTVLDRVSTRLSSLYCQCSCQATILLENRGLLQLAQAVITLQIQALKKQSNSWNGPIIFLHEPIFQMQ